MLLMLLPALPDPGSLSVAASWKRQGRFPCNFPVAFQDFEDDRFTAPRSATLFSANGACAKIRFFDIAYNCSEFSFEMCERLKYLLFLA